MNGMTEDEFFAANDFLNYTISNRYKNGQKEASKRQEEIDDFTIFYAANDIINSNGIINTDNEEIRIAFNKVYEISLDIIKYYNEVSEKKKLVTDESILDDNTQNYLLAKKQLIITYRKAFVATHEAFNQMFKRPEM